MTWAELISQRDTLDDVQALAPKQPIFVGASLLVTFGLDGDHTKGITEAEFTKRAAPETKRVKALLPSLLPLLEGRKPGPVGPFFVWSGPLCGAVLAKGVYEKTVREGTRSFESKDPIRTYLSSRGASQDLSAGGVFGVSLFRAIYDNSDQPPAGGSCCLATTDQRLALKKVVGDGSWSALGSGLPLFTAHSASSEEVFVMLLAEPGGRPSRSLRLNVGQRAADRQSGGKIGNFSRESRARSRELERRRTKNTPVLARKQP